MIQTIEFLVKKYSLFLIAILLGCATQKPVTVVPTNYDISDNLDLQAVASIFGNSSSLEDFERRLNDPQLKISNLDLNQDGYVDYLRIIETVERGTHLVTIQAALGNDLFQDVATIDVERDQFNKPYVQFIGHPYFYGPRYIIEPVYYRTPYILNSFWSPNYKAYYSPYYYNYYPRYYSYWRPIPVPQYVTNVYFYRNEKNTYNYAPERRSQNATALVRDTRRNDYVNKKPQQSFTTRNKEAGNKQALETRRNTANVNTREATSTLRRDTEGTRPSTTPRTSSSDRDPSSTPSTRQPSTTPSNRQPNTAPSTRQPSTTPSSREPSTTPNSREPSGTQPRSTTPSTTTPTRRTPSSTPTERKNSKADRS
ncbi:MAG: hypothetical protein ACI9IP_001806 [Arcticibacterium sp.]|jgi:hypothetical protein